MMKKDNTKIFNIRIDSSKVEAEVIYEILSIIEYDVFYSEAEDTDTAVVETFTYDMDESIIIRDKFIQTLKLSQCFEPIPKVEIIEKYNKNWQEVWKEFFHTERVSNRIVIKPFWEEYVALKDDVVIDIDPGMSFGTGNHPTTRICLALMDDLTANGVGGRFLDIGSGSGILSIAAAKLGFSGVTAYDYEDESVAIAKDNFIKNGVEDKIKIFKADAVNYVSEEKFDFVVANMLAHIVIESAEAIVENLKKGSSSRLILSGCMLYQYVELCEVFARLGVKEVENRTYENWKSGVFKNSEFF